MPKAVRYDEFGGIDVLRVDEVERPVPGDGQVLVRVKAAGINPSEAVIRTGALADMFPSTFPSGQGSDLAGVIEEAGAGVAGFSPGDEVIGFSNKRASQAELALVEAGDLTRKPEKVSWEVAGSLYVVGVTAWGAVHAVQPKEGETVVISGAAGGVGSLTVQLARRTGATVIGLASESNPGPRPRRRDRSGRHHRRFRGRREARGEDRRRGRGRAGRQGARRACRPDRRRTPRGADRERLPAGTGPRGLHRTRTPPHPRPDRPQAVVLRATRPLTSPRAR